MVPRDRSNGGEVFVRCAFPYKAIVNFLISRVIVSMSLHEKVFLWRGRFWLRMNAGGVLNTCKSNEALYLISFGTDYFVTEWRTGE